MNGIQNQINPTEIAEYFSSIQTRYGFKFDFSLESLEKEIDRFLEENSNLSEYMQTIIEPLLTAYIGETICRLYNGKWCGEFRGPLNKNGSNYYLCWIELGNFKYIPSHFLEYYLGNDKKNKSSFYNYLYNRDKNKESFTDSIGDGLLKQIESERK